MNAASGKAGRKDIVKIENREMKKEEVDRIALIAPQATLNIIRNYLVFDKKGVEIPKLLLGVIRCPNPGCITNTREPIRSRFEATGPPLPVLRLVPHRGHRRAYHLNLFSGAEKGRWRPLARRSPEKSTLFSVSGPPV